MDQSTGAAPAAATEVASSAQVDTSTVGSNDINLDTAEAELEANESTSASPDDQIDQAQKDGKITKQEAAQLKKQLKIKVDGQEITEELNWDDEETLKRHLQKSKAFDKRAKEHATLKNNVDAFFQRLMSGDEGAEQALREVGLDPEDFATKLMQRKIQEMEKSPEQIEQEMMRKELEDLRNEKKRAEEERSKMEMENLRNKYAAEIENEITTALAGSTLPKGNPRVVKRIAQTMHNVLSMQDAKGNPLYPDVKITDVIPVVEKEWKEELRSYFDSSAEDMIEQLVGKENFDRVRRKRLANRPTAPKANANSIKDTGTQAPKEDNRPKKSMKSFFSED